MKQSKTQKLFWKKWPYKATIKLDNENNGNPWSRGWRTSHARLESIRQFRDWAAIRFPEAGIRCETHLSIFLSTEEELEDLIDAYKHKILEVWRPVSNSALDKLLEHEYDIVRDRPWYGKYPLRARIPFNNEFKNKGVVALRDALHQLDDWHCQGILERMIRGENTSAYGWGQPLHLYLSNPDDAAMLRLMCGDYIERFERVRNPN